ncbi:DUF6580 family putative transport protein [Roseibacillus persicicus]|uniref:DUF6580 family putative transport protein n=1 Tax=Roseibacillus persicicus TaxID=454148 RepID=UPI00281025FF|nr:DUF6580 family putative transport protein [Roseibacillus persicicus]MDQ8190830.1 hypothetical protein [Roseibacillus persicicus]
MSSGARPTLLLGFIVALLVFRQIATSFEIYHFQPYIALFFGLAALKSSRWLLVPALGYLASSILVAGSLQPWMLSVLFAFALVVLLGKCFSQRSSAPALLGGSLAGAGVFYFVTNTISWLTIPQYSKTFAGFTQALWSGLPGLPPTWTFFRNDAIATVLFMGIIIVLNRMKFSSSASDAVPATS